MSIDELAAFEKAVGTKVLKIDGIWWVESPSFFFRPLFPFTVFPPNKDCYPIKSRFVGYKHPVPDDCRSNGFLNSLVYNDIKSYSLENMDSLRRRKIKIGQKNFFIKPIDDLNEFIDAGHRVYLSFYERTHYFYKKDRNKKNTFAAWAEGVFRFPKIKKDGAYFRGGLAGINLSYMVDDVVFNATFFSATDALKYHISDAVLHAIRERAKSTPKVKFIYEGALSGNRGHDEFKIRRGGMILRQPAMIHLNPLVDCLLKIFAQRDYKKLMGDLEGIRRKDILKEH